MNEKEILENYLSKKQEIEQEYQRRMRKLDENLQSLLIQLKEEHSEEQKECSPEEEKYWRDMDIHTFLCNSSISNPIRRRLSNFFKGAEKDDIFGVHTVGDFLDLTEEQYCRLIDSWVGTFVSFRLGRKSFAHLTDCIKSKGLRFSEKEQRSLEEAIKWDGSLDYFRIGKLR